MTNDVGVGAIGVVIGAFFTGLFAWLSQRSKSQAAVEVAVLAEWQKLNGALAERLSDVEKELADVRRSHSAEIEAMRKQHRAEMRQLRDQNNELRNQNEGLQRMIAQNSQSTAQLIGDTPATSSLKRAYGEGDEEASE